MDLNSLEAFLTVAEIGSFSRAGERLFLTQPAISKRIANLENQLGTTLFDRIGRDVYLTEAGQLLQRRAQTIVDEIRDIQTSVTQLTSTDIRQLNMASSHHIGLHYLGPILRQFVASNPNAKLDVRFMESEQAVSALLKRDIEIALTTIPSPMHRDLQARVLWQDRLNFVVSKDHPLAERQDRLRLNELAHLTAILPDPQTTTYQIIEKTFDRHHIPLKRVLSVNYLETIRALVSHNLGWSLLPQVMMNDQLTTLNIEGVELTRNLGIIQHRRRTVSRGTQALIELAEQASRHQ